MTIGPIELFLALDLGVLLGMGLALFFIGNHGCYEGCMLAPDKKCPPENR